MVGWHPQLDGHAAAADAKLLQSCLTLYGPIDGSLPGSFVLRILQARILEWVAIAFSNAWEWKVKVNSLSHVRLFVTPWTAAYQAPMSMGLSRWEYWNGLPLPSPGWIWVWVNSGSWWWTGRSGMLQSMASQSRTWLSYWSELNWVSSRKLDLK